MMISIELELDLSKHLKEAFLTLEGYGNEFHVFYHIKDNMTLLNYFN